MALSHSIYFQPAPQSHQETPEEEQASILAEEERVLLEKIKALEPKVDSALAPYKQDALALAKSAEALLSQRRSDAKDICPAFEGDTETKRYMNWKLIEKAGHQIAETKYINQCLSCINLAYVLTGVSRLADEPLKAQADTFLERHADAIAYLQAQRDLDKLTQTLKAEKEYFISEKYLNVRPS